MISIIYLFDAGEHKKLWYYCNRNSVWSVGQFEHCLHFCCWVQCNERKQASLESICPCYDYNMHFILIWDLDILHPCLENVSGHRNYMPFWRFDCPTGARNTLFLTHSSSSWSDWNLLKITPCEWRETGIILWVLINFS